MAWQLPIMPASLLQACCTRTAGGPQGAYLWEPAGPSPTWGVCPPFPSAPAWHGSAEPLLRLPTGSLLSLLRHLAWVLQMSGTKGSEAVKLVAAICANLRVESDPYGILLKKLQREADRGCTTAAATAAQSLPEHRLPAPPAGTPPHQLAAAARLSEAQQLWRRWGVTASASSLGQAPVQIKSRPRVYLSSAEVTCIQVCCRQIPVLPAVALLHA